MYDTFVIYDKNSFENNILKMTLHFPGADESAHLPSSNPQ